MKYLELKIPPVIVSMLVGLLMFGASTLDSSNLLSFVYPWFVAVLFLVYGIFISFISVLKFKKSKTTLSPLNPLQTNSLVSSGIYRYTRNPMYLSFYFFLLSLAFYLESLVSLTVSTIFVVYINLFQILPEERLLTKKFGNAYFQYANRVRRWL